MRRTAAELLLQHRLVNACAAGCAVILEGQSTLVSYDFDAVYLYIVVYDAKSQVFKSGFTRMILCKFVNNVLCLVALH